MKLTKTYLKQIIKEVLGQEEKNVFKNAKWNKPLTGKCIVNGVEKKITISATDAAVVGLDDDGKLFIPFKFVNYSKTINTEIYPDNPKDIEIFQEPERQPSKQRTSDPYTSNINSFGFDFGPVK